jgi:hypothetical protein
MSAGSLPAKFLSSARIARSGGFNEMFDVRGLMFD